jgi:quercetin dioxygenase-like cupin family protein
VDVFPDFIERLPELDIALEAVSGRLLQAERHQVAFTRFDRDTDVPEHSHSAQWEIVLSGEVRLRSGGEETTYKSGQSFYIPGGKPHGAFVKAGFRSVIFFDEPHRYRAKL